MSEIVSRMRERIAMCLISEDYIEIDRHEWRQVADALESAERRIESKKKLNDELVVHAINLQNRIKELDLQLAQQAKPAVNGLGKVLHGCILATDKPGHGPLSVDPWDDLSDRAHQTWEGIAQSFIAAYTSQTGGESSGN